MSEAAVELERNEHQVTPLELFFDLVFVFAITQVTSLLARDPTWGGVLRGSLVLGGDLVGLDRLRVADEHARRRRGRRAAGDARGDGGDARRRAGRRRARSATTRCCSASRTSWSASSTSSSPRTPPATTPTCCGALLRLAPSALLGASLLLVAGFLDGDARIALWLVALAIDYLGPAVVALRGWRIAPEHFAERHGLIILIALGESIVAIGVGAGLELTTGVIVGGRARSRRRRRRSGGSTSTSPRSSRAGG